MGAFNGCHILGCVAVVGVSVAAAAVGGTPGGDVEAGDDEEDGYEMCTRDEEECAREDGELSSGCVKGQRPSMPISKRATWPVREPAREEKSSS